MTPTIYYSAFSVLYRNVRWMISQIDGLVEETEPQKSCGPDKIEAKVIELCPVILAENLSLIYNKAIEIGKYPMALKVAKVTALFRKGDKYQPNNYKCVILLQQNIWKTTM